MGRRTNEKCWACSLLTVGEARKLHDAEQGGDGCWREDTCRSRRSYYRKGRGKGVKRKSAIAEVIVPIPEIPYVVLHTYVEKPRQTNDEVMIHAMCAELWVGNKPVAMTQPQHTFGLPPRLVKEYARQLLAALYQEYGDGRRSGFERYAREEQHSVSQCPVRPCSFHAAHLNEVEVSRGGDESTTRITALGYFEVCPTDAGTGELGELLGQVEAAIEQLPESERLRLAGEALLQVATVYATRSEVWMTEWEEAYRDPVVQPGFFAEMVRQTMAVDLGELMEPTSPRKPRTRRVGPTETAEGSIAATVDKEALLVMVEQLEAEQESQKQQVWAISHDENVSDWVEAIAQRLQQVPDPKVSLLELCRCLGMSWVEVWLGVLLGGFELEQRGEFYEAPIWVKCSLEKLESKRRDPNI